MSSGERRSKSRLSPMLAENSFYMCLYHFWRRFYLLYRTRPHDSRLFSPHSQSPIQQGILIRDGLALRGVDYRRSSITETELLSFSKSC